MSNPNKKKPADYIVEGDGFADITLSREATFNGIKSKTLRMREPTVDDQLTTQELSGSDGAREVAAFANLCACTPEDIRKLPLRDHARLQAAYVLFTS